MSGHRAAFQRLSGTEGSASVELDPTETNATTPKCFRCIARHCEGLSWYRKVLEGVAAGLLILGLLAWLDCAVLRLTGLCETSPDSPNDNSPDSYVYDLDYNVKPCDNFYAFVCANAASRYRDENRTDFDKQRQLEENAWQSLSRLLSRPKAESDSALLSEFKTFHRMCVDEEQIEIDGVKPVLKLLADVGGWPLLSDDHVVSNAWQDVVGTINAAGFESLFPFFLRLYADPTNSSKLAILLWPQLDAQRRVLPFDNSTMEHVITVASLLGSANSRLTEDILDCMRLESRLYQEAKVASKKGAESHTKATLTSENQYFGMAWDRLFESAFASTRVKVGDNDTVLLAHPEYTAAVIELLNETSPLIVKNYLVWRVIADAIGVMPREFRAARDQHPVGHARSLECVGILGGKAKVATGYLYAQAYFDLGARAEARTIFRNINEEAHHYLHRIEWMDADTRSRIIERLGQLKMTVGYPEDRVDVEGFVAGLSLDGKRAVFENYRRLASFERVFKVERLRLLREEDHLLAAFQYATKADAHYFLGSNASQIYAGIFQKPFFDLRQPDYLNYAGVGFTLAHVLTHGLEILDACPDDNCRSYSALERRKDCVNCAYGNYTLAQVNEKINAANTIGENIADLIGLKLAYRAYSNHSRADEPRLPGLNFTAQQMFWVNAASGLCSFQDDAALEAALAHGAHSPAEARVNVAFAHTEEFVADFSCPSGSPMNATKKCSFD